jgi:hypothetical protein
VAQQTASVHSDAEDHAETLVSPDVNSDQSGTPPNIDDNSNNPSPIPVFTGENEKDEGEYDEQQHFEEQGYDEEYHRSYEEDGQQDTEANNRSGKQNTAHEQGELEGAEGYVEEPYTAQEQQYVESDYQENDESGDYYDENQGEYMEEEMQYIEAEIEQYEVEEYDESHLGNKEDETPVEVEVVDPSITDAIDVAYLSPVASSHEELIEYEDDEEDMNPPHAPVSTSMSPTLKRLRDDSDEDGDGELDADQGWSWRFRSTWVLDGNLNFPASKRARAD